MSIRTLEVGQPLITLKYIENETDYRIDAFGMLINTSNIAKRDIMIDTIPLEPYRCAVIGNITIPEIESAVLVENYDELSSDPDIFKKLGKSWPNMYDINKEERFKGVPHFLAQGNGDIKPGFNVSLHLVLGNENIGLHRTHARGDIDEWHYQVLGTALMQKYHENDISTLFQNMIMTAGQGHDPIYAEDGVYPWHQYQSLTDSVFIGIQVLR